MSSAIFRTDLGKMTKICKWDITFSLKLCMGILWDELKWMLTFHTINLKVMGTEFVKFYQNRGVRTIPSQSLICAFTPTYCYSLLFEIISIKFSKRVNFWKYFVCILGECYRINATLHSQLLLSTTFLLEYKSNASLIQTHQYT